jgi:hypothetical protein
MKKLSLSMQFADARLGWIFLTTSSYSLNNGIAIAHWQSDFSAKENSMKH